MTLDEAIKHCEEVARTNERICATELSVGLPDIYRHKDEAKKCADDHRQLAEWLKELKAYKEQSGDAISRQALINKAISWNKHFTDSERYVSLTDIQNAPSVTPNQRTGRWIPIQRDKYIDINCSKCGHTRIKEFAYGYTVDELNLDEINNMLAKDQINYCECCGTKMEVKE